MNKVIHLISGPRNISTALMYSFAQRPDFFVLDEPFYGYYLAHVKDREPHPMEQEILDTMPQNHQAVLDQIHARAATQNVFVKNMAHHCLEQQPFYMNHWQNVILIRDPKKLLQSFAKVIEHPDLDAIGIKRAWELMEFFDKENFTYTVIESDELMIDPPVYLNQLCQALGIDFYSQMCQWPKGPIAADGIWAPYWYNNVHRSTGFSKPKITQGSGLWNAHLDEVYKQALPYYHKLKHKVLLNKNNHAAKI
ncbi:MAG TPA: sulfotransferase family protein [Flavobacteriaceae bacterium]|nr:sulfotransferase family protein [Flavobacteriaceae bacterium]